MMLVTLQQASDHLRRDTCDDDMDLALKIDAASEAVMAYLKWKEEDVPQPVPFIVQAAVLSLVGELYRDREGEMKGMVDSRFGYGYLPQSVTSLLYPLRKPSLA